MKPDTTGRESVLEMMKAVKALEASPYVRLAQAEEVARVDLTRKLNELRELEHRGRYLSASGLTLEDFGELEALDV